jgi:hypothetical protein
MIYEPDSFMSATVAKVPCGGGRTVLALMGVVVPDMTKKLPALPASTSRVHPVRLPVSKPPFVTSWAFAMLERPRNKMIQIKPLPIFLTYSLPF